MLLNVSSTNKGCSSSCNNTVQCWKWDVSSILLTRTDSSDRYASIILNQPLVQNKTFLTKFWQNAMLRVTVDGGTLQWEKFLAKLSKGEKEILKMPELITGDFDSVTEDVLQKYRKHDCEVINTPDQNYTDFTKSLMELKKYCLKKKLDIKHIVALSQTSGRIDQILGNIQTLFLAKDICSLNIKVYLISDDAISWLLSPGDHLITVPNECRHRKDVWCSLVPIGEPCNHITTSGLQWNLDNQPLMYGGLVSTSNTFDGSEKVVVKCSNTLLWSMRIPSLKEP